MMLRVQLGNYTQLKWTEYDTCALTDKKTKKKKNGTSVKIHVTLYSISICVHL